MAKHQAFIGIDPGAKGAFCALVPATGEAVFCKTTDNPAKILDWLKQVNTECRLRCIMVEEVHSIFGVSAKANFSFGRNLGKVETIALTSGAMVDMIQPKKWQKLVGVKQATKGKAIKKEVADICGRLYPNISIHGPKGGLDDGKSDALMIAHTCYLTHKME